MSTSIAVLGAGAFGTSLAIAVSQGGKLTTLWGRNIRDMQEARENKARLPGHPFPQSLKVTDDLKEATQADILLVVTPMQSLSGLLRENENLFTGKSLVLCSKGVDLRTGSNPVEVAQQACPTAKVAILSGPGFAVDIARGLPTALTLAGEDGEELQAALSNDTLRLYRTQDLTGVALGGALKNVIAIACGLAIGAGLGESARAALLTRGFAEMNRYARHHGALPETLAGLSGLGDLVLTATSEKSRNYAYGLALGRGEPDAAKTGTTIEGIATAKAVSDAAKRLGLDMPVTDMVVAVQSGHLTIEEAKGRLFSRPLKEE